MVLVWTLAALWTVTLQIRLAGWAVWVQAISIFTSQELVKGEGILERRRLGRLLRHRRRGRRQYLSHDKVAGASRSCAGVAAMRRAVARDELKGKPLDSSIGAVFHAPESETAGRARRRMRGWPVWTLAVQTPALIV